MRIRKAQLEALDKQIEEFVGLVSGSESNENIEDNYNNIGLYSAPIKGSYACSGAFSPGVPTSPTHKKGHDGVDLRASGGTNVYPISNGIVTNVGIDPLGGNVINIQYGDNLRSYYAHMGTISVKKGDKVDIDTPVGTVGDSGNAKGTFPHCHVQIWENNRLVNPANYFFVPPYTNPSDEENKKIWLSEDHKEEAKNFKLK